MLTPAGRITTFYSYKGGTGRSMALANFAWILAAGGKRVVTIDWDLEAPGLHRYFRPFLADCDLLETDGLIDAFWQLAASAMTSASSADPQNSRGLTADVSEALEDATRRLNWLFPSKGYIDFIGAGRQGATYSERVNTFDWKRFYEVGGVKLLAEAKRYLGGKYDWVLIDSRTGVSDTAGICTIQMPDSIVACFTMNRQSVDGVTAIMRSIRSYKSPSVDGSSIVFFPVATRIENGESKRLEAARGYAREQLTGFLPREPVRSSREYWDKMEISYRTSYAFEEVLAAFGDATGALGAADTMLTQVEAMSQVIAGNPNLRIPEVVPEDRAKVLAKYAFGGKPIDTETTTLSSEDHLSNTHQERVDLPVSYLAPRSGFDEPLPDKFRRSDTKFRRSVLAKEQLWRSSRFRWRMLLSKRELDMLIEKDRKSFGRDMSYYVLQSERAQSLMKFCKRACIFSYGLGFVVAALLYFFRRFGYTAADPSFYNLNPIELITGSFISSGLSFGVFSLVGISREDLPYGVQPADVVSLIVLGPLVPPISDYVPDEG